MKILGRLLLASGLSPVYTGEVTTRQYIDDGRGTGPQGPQGNPGTPGLDGSNGSNGLTGSPGPPGNIDLYTGTTQNNSSYPIGTTLLCSEGNDSPAHQPNDRIYVYVKKISTVWRLVGYATTQSTNSDMVALAGVWRLRGSTGWGFTSLFVQRVS